MRQFMQPAGIERLSLEARLIYTGFALFMLLGYASSIWLYGDSSLGVAPDDAATYYLGAEGSQERPAPETGNGPALELPADEPEAAPSAEMRFEKPARQVIETFHFHLFTMPICLLVIAHLFMMCALSRRWKAWVIVLSTLATLVHLVAPVLVRFVAPGFAWLVFPSAILMGVSWTYLTLWPIYEMWRPARGNHLPPMELT